MSARIFKNALVFLFLHALLQLFPVWAGDFNKGILWQASKSGFEPSYILGTIHSDAPTVTNLPAPVQKAFDESQSFTAELDLNMASMLQAQMQMMLPTDKSLQKILGRARYQKCVSLMRDYGVPEMIVDRMKPWAIAAQLSLPKPNSGLFLDLKLYQLAQSKGMKIYGLETAAEQMGVFESMTEQQQKSMLDQAIKDYPQMPQKIASLIRYYTRRDLRGMLDFSEHELARSDPAIRQVMVDKLIVDRNYRMVERMQPQLKDGEAFIAVGALHLPGKDGILQLLENRGYRLKAVY